MIKPFILARRGDWIGALYWFILSSIGGLLPSWGLLVLLLATSKAATLPLFTQNGEFSLYSVSMASAAFYILIKDYLPTDLRDLFSKRRGSSDLKATIPLQPIFIAIFLIVIAFDTVIFVIVSFSRLTSAPGYAVNTAWIAGSTLVAFGLTVLASFLITVLDNATTGRSESELRSLLTEPQHELEAEFTSLGRGKGNG